MILGADAILDHKALDAMSVFILYDLGLSNVKGYKIAS